MIARDEQQAMHARRREDDGVGEFQACPLADEDCFPAHGFIDFEQLKVIQYESSSSLDIGRSRAGEKFDPDDS